MTPKLSTLEYRHNSNEIELEKSDRYSPLATSDNFFPLSSVKFLGNLSDMVGFWQGCDVAILPSHREGFPKALLEAAACEIPLLGTDVAGVREIIDNEYNGLLFAKGDHKDIARKIEKMLIDQKLRHSAGKASRELIKRKGLSNHSIEAAFVELFKSIKTRAVVASDR